MGLNLFLRHRAYKDLAVNLKVRLSPIFSYTFPPGLIQALELLLILTARNFFARRDTRLNQKEEKASGKICI